MKPRTYAPALLTITMVLSGVAAAQDALKPPIVDEGPSEKDLLAKLKSRVTDWGNTRASLVTTCGVCSGSGRTDYFAGARIIPRTCSKCGGDGKSYSVNGGRKLLYEMRSPTWRKRPSAKDEAGAAFKQWKISEAAAVAPRSWRLDRLELVTKRHAIAWTFAGSDSTSSALFWIWDENQWWIWTEVADGPWPTAPEAGPDAVKESESLGKLEGIVVMSAVEKALAVAKLASKGKIGTTLILTLDYGEADREVLGQAATDAMALTRSIYAAMPTEWTEVRMVFTGLWQDRFGARERGPFATTSIAAETFRKIRWENLSAAQAFELYQTRVERREGWELLGMRGRDD